MKIKSILKIVVIGIVTFLLFTGGNSSLAAGTCAFSIGANFDGIDTTEETLKAASYYGQMGYHSFYSTEPTFNMLNGNFSNGTRRVESDILFISGHGRDDGKRIRVLQTGVVTGSTSNGFVGTNNVNWNTTKLVVYAGCLTAKEGENDHITIDTYRKGADTTLGWHQSIGAISHTKWLNRFNNKIAVGSSFSEAFIYASSFNDYDDNRVKDLGVYGDWNYVYKLSRNSEVLNNPNTYKVTSDVEFTTKKQNIEGVIELIKKDNQNFNPANYDIQVFTLNDEDNFFNIDFIRKVDGFTTNLGYNVAVKNGKVTYITNNDKEIIETRSISRKLDNESKKRYLENAAEEALNKSQKENFGEATIKEQIGTYYYDAINEQKYYKILTTLVNNNEEITVEEYLQEI